MTFTNFPAKLLETIEEDMKYINFENNGFVLFERHQNHSDIAQKFPNDKILSAGFVGMSVDEDQIQCSGESVTLKTKSQVSDRERLYRKLSIYSY